MRPIPKTAPLTNDTNINTSPSGYPKSKPTGTDNLTSTKPIPRPLVTKCRTSKNIAQLKPTAREAKNVCELLAKIETRTINSNENTNSSGII
jgi:hypothetical protein